LFAVRFGLQKFNIKANFEIKSIIQYYAQWIREGKLKVTSDWNKDLKVKFTVQDPCQLVRKTFGDPVAEDLRFVVRKVVGEENFIDMTPNKSNNYCCGGGGGFLQSGYPEARRDYGKLKFNQITRTGAHYCITPCHNCHAQIHDLSEHYEGGYQTVHLWTIICLAMGILGPKERTYLGDDLKDVLMFHPEMEE
jgi:Fe-S oxidoreductase